ncbi:peroxiredoxin family protein [Pedobacter aquatilis]|uniref:peroxiredoxin family protein n=1 Tax=Pedobacter aquatilis TaxID=351343 RepID=UPI0029316EB6|nr:redoxin domain-containing protein [Pedobacter aquatilis]
MKKINFIFLSLIVVVIAACSQGQKEKTLKEELAEIRANQIDFSQNATPKEFIAKTTDGSTFNSKDFKGKYWVLFFYDSSYLIKSESYDFVAEVNNTHKLYGDKIPMVGIANGLSEDEKELKAKFANAKFGFKQIDNTKSPSKESQVKDNVFCTPAKIIIDPKGKVIYNGCGGKTENFDLMLADLIKAEKL